MGLQAFLLHNKLQIKWVMYESFGLLEALFRCWVRKHIMDFWFAI